MTQRIDATLIAKAADEPTLGLKLCLGTDQYGFYLDADMLKSMGIAISRTKTASLVIERLHEGLVPRPAQEVAP